MLLVTVLVLGVLGCAWSEDGPTIDCSSTCECKPTVKLEYTPGLDMCHNATYEWLLHTAVAQVTELTKKLEDQQKTHSSLEEKRQILEESLQKANNKLTKKNEVVDKLEEKLRVTKKEAKDKISDLEATIKKAEQAVVKLNRGKLEAVEELEGQVTHCDQEITTLKDNLQALEARVGRRDNTIQQLDGRVERRNQRIADLEQEKDDALARERQALSDVDRLAQELETYKEQERKATLPHDCADVQRQGARYSGLYMVFPAGMEEGVEVFCDLNTEGGGWTVFQRRQDGSVMFERGWLDYKTGFGKPAREFWLGNEALHRITAQGLYELRVDMGDFKGVTHYAQYGKFSIDSENDFYKIHVDEYTGNARDALAHHNGMPFSTIDSDHDESRSGNCAELFGGGGWWYVRCYDSNLNGQYGTQPKKQGIVWFQLHNNWEPMKHAEMKIRPTNFVE